MLMIIARPKLGNGTASCTACKEIVSAVEAFIDENKDEVIDEIAKFCQLFPTADQQEVIMYTTYRYLRFRVVEYLYQRVISRQSICLGELFEYPINGE